MKDFKQEAKQIVQAVGDCLHTGDTVAAEDLIEKALQATYGERKGKMKTDKQKLLKQIRKVQTTFEDDTLDWEQKYDAIFDRHGSKISLLLHKVGIRLEYYDPDTTYEEDVTAYVRALFAIRPEVEKLT